MRIKGHETFSQLHLSFHRSAATWAFPYSWLGYLDIRRISKFTLRASVSESVDSWIQHWPRMGPVQSRRFINVSLPRLVHYGGDLKYSGFCFTRSPLLRSALLKSVVFRNMVELIRTLVPVASETITFVTHSWLLLELLRCACSGWKRNHIPQTWFQIGVRSIIQYRLDVLKPFRQVFKGILVLAIARFKSLGNLEIGCRRSRIKSCFEKSVHVLRGS